MYMADPGVEPCAGRAADICLAPPPPIFEDRRAAAAAADFWSARRRRSSNNLYFLACFPFIKHSDSNRAAEEPKSYSLGYLWHTRVLRLMVYCFRCGQAPKA